MFWLTALVAVGVVFGTAPTIAAPPTGSAATQDTFVNQLPATGKTAQQQARRAQKQQLQLQNYTPGGTTTANRSQWTNPQTYNNSGNWTPTTILNPTQQLNNLNANTAAPGGNGGSNGYTGGGGGGGGGGGAVGFDCFSMLEMLDTSTSAMQKRYSLAQPYEKMRMDNMAMQTQQPTEKSESFGGDAHGGERTPTVQAVTLPVGQCNAQEAIPAGVPGYSSKGAYNFDQALVKGSTTFKVPSTDYSRIQQDAYLENADQDVRHSPARSARASQVGMQKKMQNISDSTADSAENMLAGSMDTLFLGLINVANENAASPCASEQVTKSLSNCIWMVQQMYKNCYIYMAVLLLLPGAVMTQMKSLVSFGLLDQPEDGEAGPSPFIGIFRSIIAIFLIPATQLIVSWCIDIGNSTTYEVQKVIQPQILFEWAKEQTFNPPPENAANQMLPQSNDLTTGVSGGPDRGKLTNQSEKGSEVETQMDATRTVQMMFNFMNYCLGAALIVIIAFQIVMMCYLFLLGPIAAAFYAWPSGIGSLFNKVFSSWLDGVINVSLWRFWWCIVILCMYTRIQWLTEMGMYNPTNQWEMMMFTSFQVILVYVPFMPFEFKPGDMVDKVIEKAKEGQQQSSGGNTGGSGGAQSRGSSAGAHGHSGGKSHGHGGKSHASASGGGGGGETKLVGGPLGPHWGASDDVG
jgi:hypothetical protein